MRSAKIPATNVSSTPANEICGDRARLDAKMAGMREICCVVANNPVMTEAAPGIPIPTRAHNTLRHCSHHG